MPDPNEALPQQQRLQKRANPRARMIAAAKSKSRDERRSDESGEKNKTPAGVYYDPEKAKRAATTRRLAEMVGKRAVEEEGKTSEPKRRKREKKPRERKAREP